MSSAASSEADRNAAPAPKADRPKRGRCAVIIPAYDEAGTVGTVVEVARRANLGEVVVVDDGSRDATADRAEAAGARVVRLPRNRGKGAAICAGAAATDAEVVLLIDADLVGLEPRHLELLATPVLSGLVEMARGIFVGGRWRTEAAQRITPQLSGQRAIVRKRLLEVPGLEQSRYGVEIVITKHAKAAGWRTVDVPLEGVTQVMKEEKRGFVPGLLTRLRMYGEILGALFRPPK